MWAPAPRGTTVFALEGVIFNASQRALHRTPASTTGGLVPQQPVVALFDSAAPMLDHSPLLSMGLPRRGSAATLVSPESPFAKRSRPAGDADDTMGGAAVVGSRGSPPLPQTTAVRGRPLPSPLPTSRRLGCWTSPKTS